MKSVQHREFDLYRVKYGCQDYFGWQTEGVKINIREDSHLFVDWDRDADTPLVKAVEEKINETTHGRSTKFWLLGKKGLEY